MLYNGIFTTEFKMTREKLSGGIVLGIIVGTFVIGLVVSLNNLLFD